MLKHDSRRLNVRSLQLIKGGSFTLTIPKWWVDKQRLKKGSKLVLAEDGQSLKMISTSALRARKTAEIDLDKMEELQHAVYMVWTYYMQGADEIEVKSSSPITLEKKRRLRELRMDLQGIDIAKEDERSIKYVVAGEFDDITLDSVIRSMHSMALVIQQDAVKSVLNGDVEMASEVVGREPELLRIYRRAIRQIALCSMNPETAYKSGINNSRELITYAVLARDLNRSVYHSLYVARHFTRYGRPLDDSQLLEIIQKMSDAAYQMSELAVAAFLEKDMNKVFSVVKSMEKVRQLDEELNMRVLQTVKETDKAVIAMMIGRELRRVAGYAVAMADIAANRALGPKTAFEVIPQQTRS
ncbi:MAG: PhoU domain-containing protein [Candidatus Caldarchaeum sp.]